MGRTSLFSILRQNRYPGRGILMGLMPDGKTAVAAYFIMGRSENSRNRIFAKEGDGIRTVAFDERKLLDPSLILYTPVRVWNHTTIVTNGDQTDTIFDGLSAGKSLTEALKDRSFEPDCPNYTPRISGLMEETENGWKYSLSILKSCDGDPRSTIRNFFFFDNPIPGEGHLIHTYRNDGSPLKSFVGEPISVEVKGSIDSFTSQLWEALDQENRISLFVRYLHFKENIHETRIINKNCPEV